MTGWNLPPGCTDKDIDDTAPQEELVQCDCCGRMFPEEDAVFIRHDHPNSNVHMDTTACPQCHNYVRRGNKVPSPPDYEYEDRFEDKLEDREPPE